MKTSEAKQSPKIALMTSKPEYTEYRSRVDVKHRVVGRDKWFKFMQIYFETIAEMLTEYEGGVCIEKTFYLFYFMMPQRKIIKQLVDGGQRVKKFYNEHTDSYIYTPTIVFPDRLNFWSFSQRGSAKNLRKSLHRLLTAGHKPKNHYSILKMNHKI